MPITRIESPTTRHEPPPPPRLPEVSPAARFAGWSLLLATLLAMGGYLSLFTTFQFYDDEGYFLLSLRSYAEGHALYDEVFTQYGPLYYQLLGGLFSLLGVPFTHAAARWVVLGMWTLTSGLCGTAVFRRTRSIPFGLGAHILTFGLLSVLSDEPLHPGGLTCLALAVAAVLAAGTSGETRSRWAFVGLGLVTGCLLVVKINVGVFAALALGLALLAVTTRTAGVTKLLVTGCALLPTVPFLLMRDRLGDGPILHYALLVGLSLTPVAIEIARRPRPVELDHRTVLVTVMALAVVPALSALVALGRGTTLSGLLEGVVLRPASLSSVFCLAMDPPAWPHLWGLTSLALYGAVLRTERRDPAMSESLLEWTRFVVPPLAVASLAGLLPGRPLYVVLPFLWIYLHGPTPRAFPGVFLALLAGLQSLHAFPVAGSQVAYATFLLVPVTVQGLWEAWSPQSARLPGIGRRWLGSVATLVVCAAALASPYYRALPAAWADSEEDTVAVDLPGTGDLKLPRAQAEAYRWLTDTLLRHADGFVSLPGLNSLYLWTGLEPPTHLNTTAWPILLDADSQRRVVAALESHERPCVVVQRYTAELWLPTLNAETMPLVRYIFENFEPLASAWGYDVLGRREGAGSGE